MNSSDIVLRIQNLKTFFYTPEGVIKAVNGISFFLERTEILGLVGESGCGKSVTALSILRLVPSPGKIVSGQILLGDTDLLQLTPDRIRDIRGDRISMIFQEPMVSLNPAFTVKDQLIEALRVHRKITRVEARARAIEMLRMVEIADPERVSNEYPHKLSGGMRQRVMIAEALLLNPEILLADEPTTALDVTIQAQVVDVIRKLNKEMGTAVVLITHNLGLVAECAQRVVVFYAGKVMEEGAVEAIFDAPKHPYTQGLLKCIPLPGETSGQKHRRLHEIEGIVPNLVDLPSGCLFYPRCPSAKEICHHEAPPWRSVGSRHNVSCWLFS
jgi:peptide/nickel transport system ATP-binding protein